jgi:radical SAM superfamily enzyme YgiQ (UPF0313 family)
MHTASAVSTPDAARPVLRESVAVLLVSCYELGHQPLGIAWPKAFLEQAGYAPDALDLALEPWDDAKIRRARLVGIAVPMHTALHVGVRAAERIRRLNPQCRIVFYGLYALLNAEYLLATIADAVLGGEFEGALVALVEQLASGQEQGPTRAPPALERLVFPVPSSALPKDTALRRGMSAQSSARSGPMAPSSGRSGCRPRSIPTRSGRPTTSAC